MLSESKIKQIKSQITIFLAHCTYLVRNSDARSRGALVSIKNQISLNRYNRISSYIVSLINYERTFEAMKYIQSSAKFISDNLDSLAKNSPTSDFFYHIDYLTSIAPHINNESLNNCLKLLLYII